MRAPLILALNPSVDAEWAVPQIHFEEKNEIQAERRWAGGKGINVARWCRHLGSAARLLVPLGGTTGAEIHAHLRSEGLDATVVRIRENTRVNVIVTPPRGQQMRFNAIPPRLSTAEWTKVLSATRTALRKASVLVLSGSLPRGVPGDAYARLTRIANEADVPVVLDCEGEALLKAIPAHPLLVKPNHVELQAWYGRPLTNESALIDAARALRAKTEGWVMVSAGHRGAYLVGPRTHELWCARPSRGKVVNTVGAGDALVAAVSIGIAELKPPADWVESGVVVGTASTRVPAGVLPTRTALRAAARQVRVTYMG